MHIHIHNDPRMPIQYIGPADWAAAGIAGHRVTFGESPEDFAAQAATVEALITPPWDIKRLDLFAAPNLLLVQSTSAGVDGLQPFDMFPPHLRLLNNRGAHGEKAGEYALMAILMLANGIPAFVTDQRQKIWRRRSGAMAAARRLTIIGLGSLGGAAALQAKRLGMKVTGIRNQPAPHPGCDAVFAVTALDRLLPETDILLLACPLTPQTANLLSAPRIASLPEGAGVINIGRGKLIDQTALFAALNEGRLGGAVLDVFAKEPIPPDDPAWQVKNLIITPHMSSDDPASYNAATLAIFARNLAAHLAGAPLPTRVDFQKGY